LLEYNNKLANREMVLVEFVPKIRDRREEKGLKQKFVAHKCEISQQMLSEYENGKTFPRAHILFKIASVIGCKVDDLYERVIEDESVD
jgi:putative transcriptional regulator